jgi:dolichol kinase
MSTGLAMVLAYSFGLERKNAVNMLLGALLINLSIELTRLRFNRVNQAVVKVMGPLMRTGEVSTLSGTPYYIGATLLAVSVFPKSIALMCITFLAVGDPIASLFGVLYGHKSIRFSNGKSLVGTAAGMISCSLVAALMLSFMPFGLQLTTGEFWFLVCVGGMAGGGAELLPMEVDDNFAIPVISGFVLWLCFAYMKIA